jgi:hypothetical protein
MVDPDPWGEVYGCTPWEIIRYLDSLATQHYEGNLGAMLKEATSEPSRCVLHCDVRHALHLLVEYIDVQDEPDQPSELASSFRDGMKENADREIQDHLNSGRSVYGLRDELVVKMYRRNGQVSCEAPRLGRLPLGTKLRYIDADTGEDWHESEWRHQCEHNGIPYEPPDSKYRAEWEARYLPESSREFLRSRS